MAVSSPPKNRLLAALPNTEWGRLLPALQPIELKQGLPLYEPETPLNNMYFPENSVVSYLAMADHISVREAATIGREGMVGTGAILGDHAAVFESVVQIAGSANKLTFRTWQALESELPTLRRKLLAYTRAFMIQIMQSVACNSKHSARQRYARWLLMCHDRIDGDQINLTQEFLGQMLGVSRISVSAVAGSFQRAGIVEYARGVITIKDRRRLEAASCECYMSVRRHYDRLLPGSLKRSNFAANVKRLADQEEMSR
jgi:CRP-like cAMP-binding protein